MSAPQSSKNHTRWDPVFHFVIAPLVLTNFFISVVSTIRSWPVERGMHLWWIVMSIVLFLIAAKGRAVPLAVQDRVIRLEERTRLAALVAPSELTELGSLTIKQLVALRFASDPELPMLARRAVRENLTPKQIKDSIGSWRADNERV